MRPLTKYEFDSVEYLAKFSFDRDCLAKEIGSEDKDYHHIELVHDNMPWTGGGYSILADRIANDIDGAPLSLLVLGNSSGRPHEIEIQRLDGQPIRKLPPIIEWLPINNEPA